jgi:hypothetical protein
LVEKYDFNIKGGYFMNRKILKIVMLFLSLAVSILCVFLPIYGKIKYNVTVRRLTTANNNIKEF